jgi:hypothetical protein
MVICYFIRMGVIFLMLNIKSWTMEAILIQGHLTIHNAKTLLMHIQLREVL